MPGSVQHGHEVSDETLPGVAEATAGLRAESWTEKRWKRRHDHALHLRRPLLLVGGNSTGPAEHDLGCYGGSGGERAGVEK